MSRENDGRYRGARVVSVILKIVAAVVVLGGFISAAEAANTPPNPYGSSGNVGFTVVLIVGGVLMTAIAVMFFAYVLDLLRSIDESLRAERPEVVGATAGATAPAYSEPGWYKDSQG
jgi:hypothetical protein